VTTNSPIIHSQRARFIRMAIKVSILKLALKTYNNPITAFKVLQTLFKREQRFHLNSESPRYIKSGSSFFWDCDFPGWPSKTFDNYIIKEFKRSELKESIKKPLQTIIFAITNRCPLKCAHCFEWDKLSTVDKLSLNELKQILIKIQDLDIYHIQLSGGEPLVRFEDMIELMKYANPLTNFWLLTSGFGLTNEKASLLKGAGLTGANISLDHWNEIYHNEFRNNNSAYKWVAEAVENCQKNDIIVSLSLCATKQFISEDNLWNYVRLAKEWKVEFIRILEPRNVGRYVNSNSELESAHINILEAFYHKLRSDKNLRDYPILVYPGYYQRRIGCVGAGNRYLYIDSNADIHACPFCLNKQGNALDDSFESMLIHLKESKCKAFEMNLAD
jgi:MoaA/NifB/PqqE/SkfB family radical SAM enzyme